MVKRRRQSSALLTNRDDGRWIEISGLVRRLLHDDNDDSRHQRFIIDTGGGNSLLVSNNIDIARRVPVGIGDRVQLRGMYEWNDLGGLVHWTHHDPHGVEDGGYVQLRSDRYE